MDPDQVEELGRFLQQRAQRIERIVSDVDARVRSSSWIGTDANRFRHDWWPSHRRQLLSSADHIRGLGQSALNNASDQKRASAAGGSPARTGGSTIGQAARGTGDAALDQRLQDLLSSAKDLETIRSVYKLTQGELDEAVKLLKNGGVATKSSLPIVGILLSTADVGLNANQHGWGDGRTMFAEVDGAMGVILTPIPGGGVAWTIGTKVGEGAAHGIDWVSQATTGDTYAGHVVTGALNRAAGGDFNSLSVDEQARVATEVSQRYEGWSGLGNFIWDAAT
ncbi:MAG: hypothetical protein ACTHN0_19485 [Aquihabitans sp.]